MIPASYLYKDMYIRNWGDPSNMKAEPDDVPPRGPGGGRLAGLAGLFTDLLPLEIGRGRGILRHT